MNQNKIDIDNIMIENIRNISIISHVDHGKTTLSDHLLASGGLIPIELAGNLRALDNLPEEQRRGITIESSLASYTIKFEEQEYLVNLIDTPGHVDFSGKVAESLRLVDGSIVIVDAVEGIMAQTKTVLRQAIREQISIILFINKIDRLVTELELPIEKIRLRIQEIIGEIRTMCLNFGMKKKNLPNYSNGSILLGSALHGWAIDEDVSSNGFAIAEMMEMYGREMMDFPTISSLPVVINRCIMNSLPSPSYGQQEKFPHLIKDKTVQNDILKDLRLCDPNRDTILLIGRIFIFYSKLQSGSMIRILSGKVKKGDIYKSSFNNSKLKIMRLNQIIGRRKVDKKELKAGQIGIAIFSDGTSSGDILIPQSKSPIILDNISYVQDPVVGIVVEPMELKYLAKLQQTIELMVKYSPGLEFEIDADTGEMLILGVGTLQLDVLINDLKSLHFDVYVSEPLILTYEIPLREAKFHLEDWENSQIEAGRVGELDLSAEEIFFEDSHKNILIIPRDLNKELKEGIIEVFKHSMRISPLNGKKIKQFYYKIDKFTLAKKYETYENGMIFASKSIRLSLEKTQTTIHEPYYKLEIRLPERYLGNILEELQRIKGEISNVVTRGKEASIDAILPVRAGIRIADNFRQLTDGNVFWSFPSVEFLPVF